MNPPLTAQVPEPTEAHKTLAAKITDIYIKALRSPDVRPTRRVAQLLASSFSGSSPTPETQPAVPTWPTRRDIVQAIGRGWCAKENEHKPADVDLVFAISTEIQNLLTSRPQQPAECARCKATREHFESMVQADPAMRDLIGSILCAPPRPPQPAGTPEPKQHNWVDQGNSAKCADCGAEIGPGWGHPESRRPCEPSPSPPPAKE